ncbi:MAG TPA: PBP1A family penicillin-binding protein, partial [Gaiellaceae bacterium]|nr:PBP1A family penicillin-binding protein [Gaiellaceae bacterium]
MTQPGRPNGFGPGNGNGVRNGNGLRNGNGNGVPNHRRRRRERRRRRRASRRFAFLVILALVAAALAALAGATFTGASAASSCDLSSLRPVAIGQNSFVYASDGSLLGAIPAERNRQPLKLRQISDSLAKATIAIEDRRFFQHPGLDAEGILRALAKNVEEGRIVQGGSTITQQLVRNLYIGRERSLERKLTEACLALKLEQSWSKERILETYLNQVYFGNHAYGAEAAAQTYFSKRARKLGVAQAALLAGLPQAPSVYDPFRRPDEAARRRNDVLEAMAAAGYLTDRQFARAARAPLRLKAGKIYTKIREPYFFSFVREQLIEKYGANMVRSGGLRVHTTIDPRLQKLAIRAMKQTLPYESDPASAVVAIDPRNGAIRAMTAVAPGRKKLQFNLAAQGRRQAGSAFKTFVLTEAIRRGINPNSTRYLSAPFRWQPDPTCSEAVDPNCVWEVKTYDETYAGPSTIAQSTLRSDNSVYARLTLDVGPENVVKVARRMGIKTKLKPVASIGLGSNSVSVLEMASAYATLAAGGVRSEPVAIRRVTLANGRPDRDAGWGRVKRERVLTDGVAYEVTKILEQNMVAGTGTSAQIGRPAAGKTGTTDNFADAWFCGYTPNLATAVWVGYPNAQIEMTSVHGIRVAGGTFPAQIWGLFMEPALARTPEADWTLPTDPAEWTPFSGQYAFVGPPPAPPPSFTPAAPPAPPPPTTTAETPPAAKPPPPPATPPPPPPTT